MSEPQEPPVRVIFRRWYQPQDGTGIIALFPDLGERGDGMVLSFEHVGQHGAADLAGVTARTKPALPAEYAALRAELEAAPYRYRLEVTVPAEKIRLRLTAFQYDEVMAGMDVDHDDGNPEWGQLEPAGKRGAWLTVFGSQEARDLALYRISSSRDIWLDNAGDRMNSRAEALGYRNGGRSLAGLVRKLAEACGGPDGFSPEYRRWIAY